MTLIKLNKKIVKCRSCNRLVNFREKIAIEKRRQYIDQKYWGKPITGYGDINSQLLMIGLAPAAHGGNSCLLYTSPSPRDRTRSRMPSSA